LFEDAKKKEQILTAERKERDETPNLAGEEGTNERDITRLREE